jgi:hypothetical protein
VKAFQDCADTRSDDCPFDIRAVNPRLEDFADLLELVRG